MALTHGHEPTPTPSSNEFEAFQLPRQHDGSHEKSEKKNGGLKTKLVAGLAGVGLLGAGFFGAKAMGGESAPEERAAQPAATAEPNAPQPSPEAPVVQPEATAEPSIDPYVEEYQNEIQSEKEALQVFERTHSADSFSEMVDPAVVEALTAKYPELRESLPGGARYFNAKAELTAENLIRSREQLKAYITNEEINRVFENPITVMPFMVPSEAPYPSMGSVANLLDGFLGATVNAQSLQEYVDTGRADITKLPNSDPLGIIDAFYLNPNAPSIASKRDLALTDTLILPPVSGETLRVLEVQDVNVLCDQSTYGGECPQVVMATVFGESLEFNEAYAYNVVLMPIGDALRVNEQGVLEAGSSGNANELYIGVIAHTNQL